MMYPDTVLVIDYLKVRSHDPEEAIRHDVIVTIINAGKKDLNLVNDQLLGFVRERTLDKRVGVSLLGQSCCMSHLLAAVTLTLPRLLAVACAQGGHDGPGPAV